MAKANIVAGVSVKRPGPVDYSSDSHHCSVELTDVEIENAEQFRSVTAALFAEAKRALEAAISGSPSSAAEEKSVDLWVASSGGNGHGVSGNGGSGKSRKPAARQDAPSETLPSNKERSHAPRAGGDGASRSTEPVTNAQARYIHQLARKAGMATAVDVGSWLQENIGVDGGVYKLTKTQGSKVIDLLNNGNGKVKSR